MERREFRLGYAGNFKTFPDLRGRRLARAKGCNIYIPLRGNLDVLKEPECLVNIMVGRDLKEGRLNDNQINSLMKFFDEYRVERNIIKVEGDLDLGEKLRNYFAIENITGGDYGHINY